MTKDQYKWERTTPLLAAESKETWTLTCPDGTFVMNPSIRFGKVIDYEGIKKGISVEDEFNHTDDYRKYFEQIDEFIPIVVCPACGADASQAKLQVHIWGNPYLMCSSCSHVFMEKFPSPDAMKTFYDEHAVDDDYYMDESKIDLRIKEIYAPKVNWIIQCYEEKFGRKPKSILEFGSGAGHSLHYARQQGLEVVGLEYDSKYRAWCKEQFDLDILSGEDELPENARFDIVCSFNVLEHSDSDARSFFANHVKYLDENSVLACETPKYNSLTTEVQKLFPDSVRGGLVPYVHNHMFTDASFATIFYSSGLQVDNIWYFGQDVAELMFQVFVDSGCDQPVANMNKLMAQIQTYFDRQHGSDIMFFVGSLR